VLTSCPHSSRQASKAKQPSVSSSIDIQVQPTRAIRTARGGATAVLLNHKLHTVYYRTRCWSFPSLKPKNRHHSQILPMFEHIKLFRNLKGFYFETGVMSNIRSIPTIRQPYNHRLRPPFSSTLAAVTPCDSMSNHIARHSGGASKWLVCIHLGKKISQSNV
jgi:hypothetical protein